MFEKKRAFEKRAGATARPEPARAGQALAPDARGDAAAPGAARRARGGGKGQDRAGGGAGATLERRDGRATRARILKAAAGEFAARGYREASVRRICARANANIASVRYYFGDKLRLYKAVIDHAADQTLGQEPPPQRHQFGTAREALQAWVTWGVGFSIRRSTEQRAVSRIILREMHEPTEVFDALVRERARPVHEMLLNLVAEILGPGLGPEGVRRVGACVLAVCSQFEHGADLFERLGFPRPRTPAQVRQATDLAVRFVVGGIDRLAADLKAGEGVVP